MKSLLTFSLLALVGAVSADATAQDLLPAPSFPEYSQIAPQAYQAGPTPAAPQLPPPPASYPVPHSYALPSQQVVLYDCVRVKDRHKIHPLAVPTIVEVPDPNNRHCTVCIEICAPPCECVRVKRHGLLKRKVEFDYGKYEIDVTSRGGVVTIDYDA